MKRLLLACAVTAAAGCHTEPAAVRVAEHQTSAEPGALGASGSADPTATIDATTTTEAPATVVETTTTTEAEPEPATTVATIRRTTTTTGRRPATTVDPDDMPAPQSNMSMGPWAIPTYIVMCESGGDWNAENASGAAGPYQLMPEHFGGESALNQSREAQHAMAAKLWNGGAGARNWAECL